MERIEMGVETFNNYTVKRINYRAMKVGEIVANDLRTAAIFKVAGVDFNCAGNETLEKICKDKKLDISAIESNIDELEPLENNQSHNFSEWDLDLLCDYIMNTDHKTLANQLLKLSIYTETIADVHGSHHPELLKIAIQFTKINIELKQQMAKEEEVLFPAIKEVMHTNSSGSKSIVVSEINGLKAEHEFARNVLDTIKVVSKNYTVPPDTSLTYLLTFKLLEQLADDLFLHIHLENNILYPKALELAKQE
jgi:regulator of cell morphogenesis and NO signaling